MDGYRYVFLDFDGVVCDSNSMKAANILQAANEHVDEDTARNFQMFFVANNGVPREKKIFQYFKDEPLAGRILDRYNVLNASVTGAKLVPGVKEFLQQNTHRKPLILSGSDKAEIEKYIRRHRIKTYIGAVLAGPATKDENLDHLQPVCPGLFIGDSLYDLRVACKYGLDFIFLYQFTQVDNWKEYPFPATVRFARNFFELLSP